MKKVNILISVLLIIVAGLIINETRHFPKLSGTDVGAAFFPNLLSCLLILLAVILIVNSLRGKKNEREEASQRNSWRKPGIGFVAVIIYLVLIYYLGFYISTPIFLILFMWMIQYRKWMPVLASAGLATLFIYEVFEVLLKVPMPTGSLFG